MTTTYINLLINIIIGVVVWMLVLPKLVGFLLPKWQSSNILPDWYFRFWNFILKNNWFFWIGVLWIIFSIIFFFAK
jgi:hypothetical protein